MSMCEVTLTFDNTRRIFDIDCDAVVTDYVKVGFVATHFRVNFTEFNGVFGGFFKGRRNFVFDQAH